MSKWFSILLVALMAISLTACGGGKTCDDGTVASGGKCVPACADGETWDGTQCVAGVECAAGTHLDNGQCVSDITGCAAGTELVNGQCVPACENDEYYNVANDACEPIPECGTGTTWNPATTECEPDITDCAPGTTLVDGECVPDVVCSADTHPENGECVPNVLPDPDVTEDDVLFTVPAEGETVSLGGTVDAPVDEDGDCAADANWDQFQFAADAGTLLRIHATSEGSALPAFALYGLDADDNVIYDRYGLNPNGLDAVREVYLPYDTVYVLLVTDYNNLVDSLFGGAGIPVGGPDFTYYIEVETLPTPTPTDLDVLPANEAGAFDDGQLAFFSFSTLVQGDLVSLTSQGDPVPGATPSDAFPVLLVFDGNGDLLSETATYNPADDASAMFMYQGGDVLVVQDFLLNTGANNEWALDTQLETPVDCEAVDCSTMDLPADTQQYFVFDILQYDWFFHSVLTSDEVSELVAQIFSTSGELISESSSYYDYWYDITAPSAYLAFFPQDGSLIVRISEVNGQAVTGYTQDIRVMPEELLAMGANSDLGVIEFPEYTFYPYSFTQFDETADKLAVFADYTFNPAAVFPEPAIWTTDFDDLTAYQMDGYPTDPVLARIPTDGRYLHVLYDPDNASFGTTLWGVNRAALDIMASPGTPVDGTPLAFNTGAIDNVTYTTAVYFTAEANTGYKIEASDPNATLTPQVQVLAFYDADGYYNPAGPYMAELTKVAGAPADTGYFLAPYDGDMLVVVRDTSGAAAGGETFDMTITRNVCPLGGARCGNDGANDIVEMCDGEAWSLSATCDAGVACVDAGGSHCYFEGNTCSDAFVLDIVDGVGTATGSNADFDNNYSGSCSSAGGYDVVYAVTLDEATTLTAEMLATDGSYDTVLHLYGDCPFTQADSLACNDDYNGLLSRVSADLDAGTYYIVVDGYSSGSTGNYSLEVTLSSGGGGGC